MAVRTVEGAADWLRSHFRADAARDLSAVVQIELSGAAGGSLWLRIAGGRLRVDSEPAERADLALRLSARDYFALLAGAENAELLFMDGRMEIDGELALAMKLRSLFPPGA
jgi:putative sterol carrier protein